MRIKNLLVLALTLFCAVMAQAQVIVSEDFSAQQTKAATDQGYYEFINLQPTTEGAEKVDKWTVADGVLSMENSSDYPCTNQKWQRAIKFRNLPLKEKTLYKLSLDLKTTETPIDVDPDLGTETAISGYLDMKIMQGDENADICILGGDDSEQRVNFALNKGDDKNYSKVFYFADLAKQNAAYEKACAGKELYDPNKFFLGINVYSPGKYTLDNVLLEEATALEKIEFNTYNIRVYYGDAINAAELCGTKARKILDPACAKVSVNGADYAIDGVEVQKDGYLYIFTKELISNDAKVIVSFKNPGDVTFTGAWKGASLDFENVEAKFSDANDNELGLIMPFSLADPELVSVTPQDGSFALPTKIDNIVFKFDHPINSEGVYASINGTTRQVAVKDSTVIVTGGDFPKGAYTVNIYNVANANWPSNTRNFSVSFETGELKMSEIVYTDLFTTLLEGDNNKQPTGWTIMVGGSAWTGGTAKADNGSACRNQNITGSDGKTYTAFYLCDREGYTYMKYGDQEGYNISLPAGNIEFSVIAVGHDADSKPVEFRLEDMNGNVVATGNGTTNVSATGFTTLAAAGTISTKFTNDVEQNFILKIHETAASWDACRVLGFKARSYVETEGDKPDSKIVFTGSFTGDTMPAEGSGWLIYDNNNYLTPGSARDQSSGILQKNFHKNLQSAYFCRVFGTNDDAAMRMEYGNGNGVEGGLELASGKYEIVYYAGNWSDSNTDNSWVYMQLVNVETGAVEFYSKHKNEAYFNNGGACNGQADEVHENFSCAGGKYIIKVWGTTCTVWGGLTIEKEGSLAAKWYSKLATAVTAAKEELTLCESEELDGTAKTALTSCIAKYEHPSGMYTVAAFEAAIAEVNAATTAMSTRRVTMAAYNEVLGKIKSLMATIDATPKYKGLDCYKALEAVYNQYMSVAAKSLENEELVPVTESLQFNYNLTNNMCTTGVALLTKQMTDLVQLIKEETSSTASSKYITKSKNAIFDDQQIAYVLKLKALKAIYDKCASGDPFNVYDPDLEIFTRDSINVSSFIQNANVYTTETSDSKKLTDVKNVPGWDINIIKGDISVQWSWSTWNGSETNPVNDAFLLNGWNGDFMMEQNVSLLPVGTYRYVSGTQDRGMGDTSADKTAALETMKHWTVTGTDGTNAITGEIFSYIYWQTKDGVRDSVPFDITSQGQYYSLTNDASKSIDVNATGENPYGDLLIGTRPISYQSSASVDNFQLYMTGMKEGFDYAAAAKAVQKLIEEYENPIPDVNGDTFVDQKDIDAVIAVIGGSTEFKDAADVDGDGNVDVIDVNLVINAICNPQAEE